MTKSALDFIRLATWDITEHAYSLSDILTNEPGEWEPGKWLQYHGWRKDSHFIGTGEQNHKRHSIINVSGYKADAKYKSFLKFETYYATRIDIQITIRKPSDIDLSTIYKQWSNDKTKISLIQSEQNDTLYIGQRTSPVFIRLYEKPLDSMYLRLEFEFKGRVARGIWRALQSKSHIDEIFQHYLYKSHLPDPIKVLYSIVRNGDTKFAIRKEIMKTDRAKLDWLRTIDSSVRQALYNDNIGLDVRELVISWASEAANVDIINEID